jgi:hypothetical protein
MPELDKPITTLSDSDKEVLQLVGLKMPTTSGQRMNTLLAQQREGTLSDEQGKELFALFQLYQRLWLRQSEALVIIARIRQPSARGLVSR